MPATPPIAIKSTTEASQGSELTWTDPTALPMTLTLEKHHKNAADNIPREEYYGANFGHFSLVKKAVLKDSAGTETPVAVKLPRTKTGKELAILRADNARETSRFLPGYSTHSSRLFNDAETINNRHINRANYWYPVEAAIGNRCYPGKYTLITREKGGKLIPYLIMPERQGSTLANLTTTTTWQTWPTDTVAADARATAAMDAATECLKRASMAQGLTADTRIYGHTFSPKDIMINQHTDHDGVEHTSVHLIGFELDKRHQTPDEDAKKIAVVLLALLGPQFPALIDTTKAIPTQADLHLSTPVYERLTLLLNLIHTEFLATTSGTHTVKPLCETHALLQAAPPAVEPAPVAPQH